MKTTVPTAALACPAARSAAPASNTKTVSRLRKYLTSSLLSLAVFNASPVFAADPCKTVMCMFGKFTGNSSGECNSAVQDYFSIKVKKHGNIKWNSTSSAREEFLNSCPSADRGFTKKINDKFGKASG